MAIFSRALAVTGNSGLEWLDFFFPNSRALLPTFRASCPDRSHFAKMASFSPEYHPHFLFFTQQSHTPFGDTYIHKNTPTPPQNTPFSGLNLKVGKMNYSLGNMRQIWAICTKSGQQCSRSGPTSGQEKFIHVTGVSVVWMVVMSLVS